MLWFALGLTLFGAPGVSPETAAPGVSPTSGTPSTKASDRTGGDLVVRGRLVLGPGYQGAGRVLRDGEAVASLELRPDRALRLDLPLGSYRLELPGEAPEDIELWPEGLRRRGPEPVPEPLRPQLSRAEGLELEPAEPEPGAKAGTGAPASRRSRRRAAASILIPGLGQMLQGQGPKGAGILVGTMGLAAAALLASRPPLDPTRRDALNEGARLGGFGLATGALMTLYAGQVMDAFAVARGRPALPDPAWRFRAELQRGFSLSSGVRPDSVQYLSNWSVSIMGQPAPRVLVGASDISLVDGGSAGGFTTQLGLRAGYRVVQRKALWLATTAGVIAQVSVADNPRFEQPGAGPQAARQVTGSGSFFAQLELQWFIVDRWSIDLRPRFYVPVGSRRFASGRAVPSYSPSFELGTGVGVQF